MKKEVDEVVTKIIDIGDKVKKKSKELEHERHVMTHTRISQVRQQTDRMEMNKDAGCRPSDKQLNIRTYSKMDSDIWKYEDVRKWFNTNAPKDELIIHESPSSTGFMISR